MAKSKNTMKHKEAMEAGLVGPKIISKPVTVKKNYSDIGVTPTLEDAEDIIKELRKPNSPINRTVRSHNIADRYDMDWCHKFSRFGVLDPFNALTTTKEYIFITKPDLCILQPNSKVLHPVWANNAFFTDAVDRYRDMVEQLQYSADVSNGPFMNILSNTISSSLDLPDISAESIDTGSNIMGTKITYRGTSYKSHEDLNFNLEFEDNKYLDIYMLFKIYDEFEKAKWNGELNALFEQDADGVAPENRWLNYTVNKILYDQVSMYKFVVAEDGMRIIYMARITGCFPDSISRSNFSDMNNSDPPKVTVGWKGHFVRDADPLIIANHFNHLVGIDNARDLLRRRRSQLPLFDSEILAMNGEWASFPFIDIRDDIPDKKGINSNALRREYYLAWSI